MHSTITDGLLDCLLLLPTNFLLVNSCIIYETEKLQRSTLADYCLLVNHCQRNLLYKYVYESKDCSGCCFFCCCCFTLTIVHFTVFCNPDWTRGPIVLHSQAGISCIQTLTVKSRHSWMCEGARRKNKGKKKKKARMHCCSNQLRIRNV